MPKQLINIAGVLITVVVLALGVMLGAVPLFTQAQATHRQADQVEQTNGIHDIQVQSLRAQEAKIDELDAELAALRAEIPDAEFNDQVFELIVSAAAATRTQIVSASAGEPIAWVAPVRADGTSPATDAAAEAAAQAAAAAAAEAETDADDAETTTPAPAPAPVPDESPRLSVPFQISVVSMDPTGAMDFVDRINSGTRLLGIENVTFTVPAPTEDDEEGAATPTQLTVTLHSLVFSEK